VRSGSSARPPGQRLIWLRGPGTNRAHEEGRPGSRPRRAPVLFYL